MELDELMKLYNWTFAKYTEELQKLEFLAKLVGNRYNELSKLSEEIEKLNGNKNE